MFTFCYAAKVSPKKDIEKLYLNPIYHKLGKKAKTQRSKVKDASKCQTSQSIISTYAYSRNIANTKHARINSDCAESVCLRNKQPIQKTCMTSQKTRVQTMGSIIEPLSIQIKYSQLQDKYINILERVNFDLEKALSSKKQQHSNQSKSLSKSKIGAQLRQLKNRLNSIDLTGINKLAKINIRSENCAKPSKDGKQNKTSSTFRQFRSNIS